MSTTTAVDDRVATTSSITRIMRRPEIGAAMGALVVYIFFAFVDQTGTFFSLDWHCSLDRRGLDLRDHRRGSGDVDDRR